MHIANLIRMQSSFLDSLPHRFGNHIAFSTIVVMVYVGRYINSLANSADVARLPYFLSFCGALNAKNIYDAPCGPEQMDEQMYKEEESL